MKKKVNKGEIMRNAQRLIKAKGDGSGGYAEKMAEMMQEAGEEDDQAFWEKIAPQVELLDYEPD